MEGRQMTDMHRDTQSGPLERRSVEVEEPGLSDETNAQLTEEVRDVVGSDRVEVPAARHHASHGETVRHRRPLPLPFPLPENFAIVQVGAALVVVAAVVVLAVVVHHWWTLALAVVVLFAMAYLVVATSQKMTSTAERPSPRTVAAMEEEGVSDPEEVFSDIVDEFTPDEHAAQADRGTTDEEEPANPAVGHRLTTAPRRRAG